MKVPNGPGLITQLHGQASASFRCDWLRDGLQLGLVLLSDLEPQARTLILNPLHPAMVQLALVHQEPFWLDQCLAYPPRLNVC